MSRIDDLIEIILNDDVVPLGPSSDEGEQEEKGEDDE